MQIDLPGVAIIIGCWEEHKNPKIISCYKNIIEKIENTPSITHIILSNNHCKINQDNESSNQWFTNSNRIFDNEQGVDWIRRHWQHTVIEKGWATPATIIKDHNWKQQCLLASEQWQIEYYLNHYMSHIKNLWYFGIGWTHGVMQDPIGWGQTCDLIKYKHIQERNIITDKSCILKNLETHSDFRLSEFAMPELIGWRQYYLGDNDFIKTDYDWSV